MVKMIRKLMTLDKDEFLGIIWLWVAYLCGLLQ